MPPNVKKQYSVSEYGATKKIVKGETQNVSHARFVNKLSLVSFKVMRYK